VSQQLQTAQQIRANKISRIQALISNKAKQIERALPRGGVTAERMVRIVLTAISMNKALWECSEESLLAAVMQAAQLGLEPDGVLGMASLVPFGNRVQLVIGYRGYIQLALRSGAVRDIRTRCVFEGDTFEVGYGLEEKLVHVPSRTGAARAAVLDELAGGDDVIDPDPLAVYGVAVFNSGGNHFEVLYPEDIERIRACSKGWKHPDSPWQKHKQAMWRKSAVKQTLKYCPMASESADLYRNFQRVDDATFSSIEVTDEGEVLADSDRERPATVQVPVEAVPALPTANVKLSAMDAFVTKAAPAAAPAAVAATAAPAAPSAPAAPAADPRQRELFAESPEATAAAPEAEPEPELARAVPAAPAAPAAEGKARRPPFGRKPRAR
jgi:recombination protein RecT